MKILLLLVFVSIVNAKKCNDGLANIHNLISTLYDYINHMETQVRVQYYQFHADRLNTITSQLAFLKSLQNGFFAESCNYQLIDEGRGIYLSSIEYFHVITKNVFYAVKSSVDDLRNQNLNIIYLFLQNHNNFVESIAQQSINLLSDGKDCVMTMENDIKTYFDTTVRKLMEGMRRAAQTDPLNVPTIGGLRGNLQGSFGQLAYYSRAYFGGTSRLSNQRSNETVANNYNNVR